jgi:hypothetical protein
VTLTVLMFISAVLLAHSNPDDGQAAPEPV